MDHTDWEIPDDKTQIFKKTNHKYCVCIPVINEGQRIKNELRKMHELKIAQVADIIICDGGSTDGSLESTFLMDMDVYTLLIKTGPGKLSAQLRMGYSYALLHGYKGIITIDGNGKDNPEAIFDFIKELQNGYDFIQGSRYCKGGKAINTPFMRTIAVKLLHIPVISALARYPYSDTTNGYRGYSDKLLRSSKIAPFRAIFNTYELLAYLSVKAPREGFKTKEIPVTRRYPEKGKVPTKISFIKGNSDILKILFNLIFHKYDVN